MIVNVVTVQVIVEHIPAFIAATVKNHVGSRQEPGNLRFDVLQAAVDPGRFMLYEIFASQEAVEAHRRTPHYLEWRAAVDPMMAKPRALDAHILLAPSDSAA